MTSMLINQPTNTDIISLDDHRFLRLQEKQLILENNLSTLLSRAKDNEHIINGLHKLALVCLQANTLQQLRNQVRALLLEHFQLPHVELALFHKKSHAKAINPALISATQSMHEPLCGYYAHASVIALFPQKIKLQSFAQLPLFTVHPSGKSKQTLGLLVFASEDGQHFQANADHHYLQKMGELVSAAVGRIKD